MHYVENREAFGKTIKTASILECQSVKVLVIVYIDSTFTFIRSSDRWDFDAMFKFCDLDELDSNIADAVEKLLEG